MNRIICILTILTALHILRCTSDDNNTTTLNRESLDFIYSEFLNSKELIVDSSYISPSKAIKKNLFTRSEQKDKYKAGFKKIYTRAYKDYQKLPGNPIQNFRFLFLHYLYYEIDSVSLSYKRSNKGEKNNPLFAAYSLLVGSGINSLRIGEAEYIKLLSESFGIEPFYVRCAILGWLEFGVSLIEFKTVEMIKESVVSFKGGPEEFLAQILVPYMQMVLTGRNLKADVEKQIEDIFRKTFSSENELKAFVNAYRKTMNSGTLHVKFLNNLNSVLKKHGYYMTASYNDCSAYKIVRSSKKLDLIKGSRVLMLKKISIGLTSAFYGRVRVQEKDIILLPENLDEEAQKLFDFVNKDSEYSFYNSSANKVWSRIGLDMSTAKADSIRNSFIKREFKGMGLEEIRRKLEISTIIHEIKHIWDEVKDPRNKHIWNIDSEYSAYMSQAILSDLSYENLFSHIAAQENFYLHSIHNEAVCNQVGSIIVDLWDLILSEKSKNFDSEALKLELEKKYTVFKTMDGYKLPSLKQYKNELPRHLVMTNYEEEKDTLIIR